MGSNPSKTSVVDPSSPERPPPFPSSSEESPAPRSTSSGISRNTSSSIESSSSGQSPTQAKPSKSRESPKAKPSKKRRKSRAKSIEDVAAQIAAEDALLVSMGMKRSRDETKLLKDLMKESDKLYKKSPKSPMHPVLPSPTATSGVLQSASEKRKPKKRKLPPKVPKPKHPHRLQRPTDSQKNFFEMLDKKIAEGPDYVPEKKEAMKDYSTTEDSDPTTPDEDDIMIANKIVVQVDIEESNLATAESKSKPKDQESKPKDLKPELDQESKPEDTESKPVVTESKPEDDQESESLSTNQVFSVILTILSDELSSKDCESKPTEQDYEQLKPED